MVNLDNPNLTKREKQAFCSFANGNQRKQVAAEMGIYKSTADKHIDSAFTKLRIHSQAEAIHYALAMRWIPNIYNSKGERNVRS